MANEIFKELKTKIALKQQTYAEWTANTATGANYIPFYGEVCFCEIPAAPATGSNEATTAPTVLFKVGTAKRSEDGSYVAGTDKKFSELKWASALAADVYDWAKTANLYSETDGAGNAITSISWDATLNGNKGGLKFTKGETFATKEELEELRGGLEADTNTTYNFSIPAEGPDKGKLLVEKKEIGETTWTKVDAYDFITPSELNETLNGKIHTEEEIKAMEIAHATAAGKVDTAITVKVGGADVVFDGSEAKTADVDAAIEAAINAFDSTAKGYADAVLGNSNDQATANTVYGAKAAAAAAQNDATIAKTKIETFLGTVTPDGSQDIIDTLTEINNYVGEHGEEFAALSEKVTKIENGTTSTTAGDLTAALETEIKGYTVANAEKLNGLAASYYATAESVTDITKENGIIDNKIANKMDKVSMPLNTIALFDGEGNVMGTDWTINPDQHYLRSSWGDDFIAISMQGGFSVGEVLYDENDEPVNTSVNYDYDSINFKTLDKEGTLTYPNKSGTIAITDDIQTYTAAPNGGLKVENNAFAIDDSIVFVLDCNW